MSESNFLVPILMFGSLLIIVLLGVPVAFGTAFVALLCGYILWGARSHFLFLHATIGTMNNWLLLSVPLFVFMTAVLEKSGIVEDLYDTFYKWFSFLRGGLAIGTVMAGTLLGAMTGVVSGSVSSLGLIALPQMLKYKYNKGLAIGSVLSAGTLAQLIPPSTLMIIYGAITETSIGALFAGGITSGLLLSVLYCLYIAITAYLNHDLCPIATDIKFTWKQRFTALGGVILPILLVIGVLGSIFTGAATPTEAAAVGCTGAVVCALIKGRFKWSGLKEAATITLVITAMVGWITIGAMFFSGVFAGTGGNKLVADILKVIPFGAWGLFSVALVLLIFFGMFLDTVAIIVLLAPMLTPALISAGFDNVYWGIVFIVALQLAYLTPPFGGSLFVLKGVAPKNISLQEIIVAAYPFIILQLVGIGLIIAFPEIALWLPGLLVR